VLRNFGDQTSVRALASYKRRLTVSSLNIN
jgi:hypothetical protein